MRFKRNFFIFLIICIFIVPFFISWNLFTYFIDLYHNRGQMIDEEVKFVFSDKEYSFNIKKRIYDKKIVCIEGFNEFYIFDRKKLLDKAEKEIYKILNSDMKNIEKIALLKEYQNIYNPVIFSKIAQLYSLEGYEKEADKYFIKAIFSLFPVNLKTVQHYTSKMSIDFESNPVFNQKLLHVSYLKNINEYYDEYEKFSKLMNLKEYNGAKEIFFQELITEDESNFNREKNVGNIPLIYYFVQKSRLFFREGIKNSYFAETGVNKNKYEYALKDGFYKNYYYLDNASAFFVDYIQAFYLLSKEKNFIHLIDEDCAKILALNLAYNYFYKESIDKFPGYIDISKYNIDSSIEFIESIVQKINPETKEEKAIINNLNSGISYFKNKMKNGFYMSDVKRSGIKN